MRFCEDIQYDAPITQLSFDKKFLNMKIAQTPASVCEFLKERLRGLSPDKWPERDELALVLCMSNSTLQRQHPQAKRCQDLCDILRAYEVFSWPINRSKNQLQRAILRSRMLAAFAL
jgi:hypothetical protein